MKSGNIANAAFVPTSGNFGADAGATSILIDYINLPVSTALAVVWVEYGLTFRGRKFV